MTETTTPNIVEQFFPLESPRKTQAQVILEVDSAFKSGYKVVILEAPVGSGKSAIAVTLARAVGNPTDKAGVGGAHLITPRKGLQDQYFEDFNEHLVLMKGRNAYPCTAEATPRKYASVIKSIKAGQVIKVAGEDHCGDAPCKGSLAVFKACSDERPCPFTVAVEVASDSGIIVHNLHSFIYQTNFGNKFDKRELLVIDEAHDVEGVVRDFITKKLVFRFILPKEILDGIVTTEDGEELLTKLLAPGVVPIESEFEIEAKQRDERYKSSKDEYLEKIESLRASKALDGGFSLEAEDILRTGTQEIVGHTITITPHSVGNSVQNLLLSYGTKVLLMSGTIYDKTIFCRNLGIPLESAYFLRVGSSFPAPNRPIYLKPEYQTNTSFQDWENNFDEMVSIINRIIKVFGNARGLIHASSYAAAAQICRGVNSTRLMTHGPENFAEQLLAFYESAPDTVFVSPVCQQGVDFKGDRARFQIVTRIPYPSMTSKFIQDKVRLDFAWYNYQALVVFGQQIGRVNRSEKDYGATFLLDERFNKFIAKNAKLLPNWVKEGMVWK